MLAKTDCHSLSPRYPRKSCLGSRKATRAEMRTSSRACVSHRLRRWHIPLFPVHARASAQKTLARCGVSKGADAVSCSCRFRLENAFSGFWFLRLVYGAGRDITLWGCWTRRRPWACLRASEAAWLDGFWWNSIPTVMMWSVARYCTTYVPSGGWLHRFLSED